MSTAVLYHAGCPDGWCAAYVAYNALKDQEGVVAELIPVTHGQPPPDLVTHERVFIVDFAYTHEEMAAMAIEGQRTVIVLDHHRTAIDAVTEALALEPVPDGVAMEISVPYRAVFDTGRSGAGITWDWFWPEGERPDYVDYVEDRDLWRWKLPHSRRVNAYLKAQPYDVGTWDDVTRLLTVDDWVSAGTGVLLHIEAYARAAAGQAFWCVMGGRSFPIVNISYESCSDVLDHMLKVFDSDIVGYFFARPDGLWQYGFRAREGAECRSLAERFGGGGHATASGCQVPELVHERVDR